MAIRRTRLAPLVALTPAVLITAVAFLGAIVDDGYEQIQPSLSNQSA